MKLYNFKEEIRKPFFTSLDVRIRGLKVFPYQFSYWKKINQIGQVKKGFYYFTSEKDKIKREEISFLLYEPSYISLESALSHYSFIPDAVQTLTAVTTKTTRSFSNDFGQFSYRHIDPKIFFGYVPIETENAKYLLAEPEKAILDYFYFNLGAINSQADIEEMRFNYFEMKEKIDFKKLNQYLKTFRVKKMETMLNLLFQNVNSLSN